MCECSNYLLEYCNRNSKYHMTIQKIGEYTSVNRNTSLRYNIIVNTFLYIIGTPFPLPRARLTYPVTYVSRERERRHSETQCVNDGTGCLRMHSLVKRSGSLWQSRCPVRQDATRWNLNTVHVRFWLPYSIPRFTFRTVGPRLDTRSSSVPQNMPSGSTLTTHTSLSSMHTLFH